VQHTINQLLNGSGDKGVGSAGVDGAPLDEAVLQNNTNPHHFIMGAQSSVPEDANENPWNGSWDI
jgi:Mn-containing catalase